MKEQGKKKLQKAAKGVKIVYTVIALLVGLGILAVLVFVGVRLWGVLSPLFGF